MADEDFILPEHVEYFSLRINPHKNIGHRHELEIRLFRIWKVNLRLPNSFDEVWVREVKGLSQVLVLEPLVPPLLTKVEVNLVVLRKYPKQNAKQLPAPRLPTLTVCFPCFLTC